MKALFECNIKIFNTQTYTRILRIETRYCFTVFEELLKHCDIYEILIYLKEKYSHEIFQRQKEVSKPYCARTSMH